MVKQLSIVCAVWTVAYVIKFVAVFEGTNILYLKDQNTIDLVAACSMALIDYLTLIIPYYCVVDFNFINYLTCAHLLEGGNVDADALLDTEFQPIDMTQPDQDDGTDL